MRILVVGAGAVGGWFGGHLAAAGRDVTFLVRDHRARELAASGLVLDMLDGPIRIDEPETVTAATLSSPYDVVLLTVKAFGLGQALVDLAPAVGPSTMIVPMLNGLAHFDALTAAFGPGVVVGGLCRVATQLEPDGTIRQLLPGASMAYGELDGSRSPRILTLDEAFRAAGFETTLSSDVEQDLWEKWFFLASGGALLTLLGGDVGAIEAVPHGADTARTIIDEFIAIARAAGHEPRQSAQKQALATLTKPGSHFTTSTFRDWRAGYDVESEQLLGDLVRRGRELGVASPLLAAAHAHLEVYRAAR